MSVKIRLQSLTKDTWSWNFFKCAEAVPLKVKVIHIPTAVDETCYF